MKKYSIEDFINQKIIVRCDYCEAKAIVSELRGRNIDTTCIDELTVIYDHCFNLTIDNNILGNIISDSVQFFEKTCEIIDFSQLDVKCAYAEQKVKEFEFDNQEFKLNDIVHAIIQKKKEEQFNPFAKDEHQTVIITAIDRVNNMCEITYLKNSHISQWISNKCLFHIEHTYDAEVDSFDDYDFISEDELFDNEVDEDD